MRFLVVENKDRKVVHDVFAAARAERSRCANGWRSQQSTVGRGNKERASIAKDNLEEVEDAAERKGLTREEEEQVALVRLAQAFALDRCHVERERRVRPVDGGRRALQPNLQDHVL